MEDWSESIILHDEDLFFRLYVYFLGNFISSLNNQPVAVSWLYSQSLKNAFDGV